MNFVVTCSAYSLVLLTLPTAMQGKGHQLPVLHRAWLAWLHGFPETTFSLPLAALTTVRFLPSYNARPPHAFCELTSTTPTVVLLACSLVTNSNFFYF